MKRILSTLVLSLFAVASASTLSACNDDEVAAGVVGAVIGAGVATVISNGNDNGRNCDQGYRTVCSNYYDYYGNLRRECREVRNQCRYESTTESALALAASGNRIQVRQHAAANGLTVEAFAKEYWLSFEKAELYWTALDAADQGNAAPLRALGLSSEDLQLLGNFELPTAAGTEALAKSLDQRSDRTTAMMNRVATWSLYEKNRICATPVLDMTEDERSLCNAN